MTLNFSSAAGGSKYAVRIEFGVRRPGRAGGQGCASLPQLALAEIVRNVDEVKFVFDAGAFEELPEPLPGGHLAAHEMEPGPLLAHPSSGLPGPPG
jgi:hypothetical protein